MLRKNVFWFTGLSGAGKTAVAARVLEKLKTENHSFTLLDGDVLRNGLCKDLNFTLEDRKENIRRAAEISKLLIDAQGSCLCTFISPTHEIRKMAKEIIGENAFHEIYINTPLEICEKRDPKGLYQKVRQGDIANFTGIDSVYEEPINPDYILDCVNNSIEESAEEAFQFIKQKSN